MAVIPVRLIARVVGRWLVGKGAEIAIEEATGREVTSPIEAARDVAGDLFGTRNIEELNTRQVEEALVTAEQRGRITQEELLQLEDSIMVDFNTFMSIGLNHCGTDKETFGQLVQVWNREKDDIRNMTARQVRENLTCP